MNRVLAGLLTACLLGLVPVASTGVEAQDLPGQIMIENEGYRRKLYQAVPFPHLSHAEDYGIECNACHHKYQDGKNVWQEGDPVVKCAVCHNPKKGQGKVLRLVFAYHFNCRTCHMENDSGPKDCGECHTKKTAP